MDCIKRELYFLLVFLTFLHQECSKMPFLQGPDGNPVKKENVKCVVSKKRTIKKKEYLLKSFTGLVEMDARQKKPIDRIVPAGTNFTYQCCGESVAIYRFGLYKRDVLSPSSLFSRVEINIAGPLCSVFPASTFSSSRYSGRMSIEYNTSTKCVLWVISNVTKEDENTFVAVVKDNFAMQKNFKDCIPVSLIVSKAETPVPTRPPTQTTATTTTEKPKPSPTTPQPPSFTKNTTSKPAPSDNTFEWWKVLLIVLAVVALPVIWFLKKRMWQCPVVQRINNNQEDESDFKDNLAMDDQRA